MLHWMGEEASTRQANFRLTEDRLLNCFATSEAPY
jgi:hypothetical protein